MPNQRTRRLRISGKGVLFSLGLLWLILIGFAERRLEGNYLWLWGANYDSGEVSAGQLIDRTVWVFNPTLRGFHLSREATCGCMVAEVPSSVSPLSGFFLRVQVDTTGYRPGEHTQQVWLIVRDESHSWRETIRVRFSVVERSAKTDRR